MERLKKNRKGAILLPFHRKYGDLGPFDEYVLSYAEYLLPDSQARTYICDIKLTSRFCPSGYFLALNYKDMRCLRMFEVLGSRRL